MGGVLHSTIMFVGLFVPVTLFTDSTDEEGVQILRRACWIVQITPAPQACNNCQRNPTEQALAITLCSKISPGNHMSS